MKRLHLLFVTFFSLSVLSALATKPYGLMTDLIEHTDYTWQNGYVSNVPVWEAENAIEPLQYAAIASERPSFSWIVPGTEQGTKQVAFRIILSDSYQKTEDGLGNVWDSGWMEGRQSTSVLYGGEPLQPGKNYFWRVKTITNTEGESQWSEVKAFRTAERLSDYAVSAYPLVKTMEYPVSVREAGPDVTVIDFGKAAFGQLVLTLASETVGGSIVVHLGECMANGRVDRNPDGTIRYHRYTLRLMKGTHSYRIKIAQDKRNTGSEAVLIPGYIGEVMPFRYCEIECYDRKLTAADIVRESVHYPFDESASHFVCSNDTLNRIWELCKYSIKATSFTGIYIDGDRERIPYEADALINQLCHYGVDREYSMARRSYEYLLEHPTWPTEWILQAIIIAWNDYLYTGDSRPLKVHYEILKARSLMSLREKNGLISTTTDRQTSEFQSSIRSKGKIRDIVDWPHTGILGLNKDEAGEADGFVFTDYNVVTNAYHYEALKLMGRIMETLGRTDESSYYTSEAEQFLKRFNKLFLNKKQGIYVDGDTTVHASLHANMFPAAFGMVPAANKAKVMNFIRSRRMACSVYGAQFLMDALYEAPDAAYALSLLTKTDDRSWYNMLRAGSTISLEAWDNKYKPNQDWNHAWGAVPANIIPRKLMGVEPLLPGFDKVRIRPQTASLYWSNASIPTIKGTIRIEIENKKGEYRMNLTIPANMESEVYLPLPEGKYEVSCNGTPCKTTRVKGEPFIHAGSLPSGSYTFVITENQPDQEHSKRNK
jgi:hypothetical protein